MHSLSIFMFSCLIISALPGPSNILTMTHAISSGGQQACIGALGRFPGFGLLVLISAILFNSAIAIDRNLFRIIQIVGCFYMAYIGIKIIRHRHFKIAVQQEKTSGHYFRAEFFTALSNPKAIIVFTGFFPNFITLDHSIIGQFLFLGLLSQSTEVLMAICYATIGSAMKISNIPFPAIYMVSGSFIILVAFRILYGIF